MPKNATWADTISQHVGVSYRLSEAERGTARLGRARSRAVTEKLGASPPRLMSELAGSTALSTALRAEGLAVASAPDSAEIRDVVVTAPDKRDDDERR